ncbi:MAG: (d)CMP kinase [Anaerolineae bacterium]
MKRITIAIDGPAASGKSTIAERLATKLGYLYFDTGVMYRAVTWAALNREIPISDESAVTELANSLHIGIEPSTIHDGRQYTVLADSVDITWKIREPDVNREVSPVSAYRGVRTALTAQQRRIGLQGGVVMVGRDIGSVVLPEADLKVYLDASLHERARRRFVEFAERGSRVPFEDVVADLARRDEIDSSRDVAPLSVAEGAVYLDTTRLDIEQVVARILSLLPPDARGLSDVGA